MRLFLRPRENLDAELAKLKRYLLKCLEPIRLNNRPRNPKMMRLGERHNWEFNYRHGNRPTKYILPRFYSLQTFARQNSKIWKRE